MHYFKIKHQTTNTLTNEKTIENGNGKQLFKTFFLFQVKNLTLKNNIRSSSNILAKFLIFHFFFLVINGSVLRAQDIEKIDKKDPIKLTGSISASSIFFDVSGRESNRKPFSWIIRGNPTLSLYGITLPFSFTVSEQTRDFRQPFNRFGVSPYYKWIKLHLGYQKLNFSPYSLGGHTMVGVGAELTPGNLRFGFMTGRLLRATEERRPSSSQVEYPATFKRSGTSVKIGYGTNNNFVDFIFLKAEDDPNSVEKVHKNLSPKDNAVFSIVTRQKFLKKFDFKMELAQSAYSDDSRTAVVDSIDSNLFKTLNGFFTPRKNTEYKKAIEASLAFSEKYFGLAVRYKRIDPGFRSLGTYFFLNDLQNITFEPYVIFWQGKVNINGSLGFQKDNLEKEKSTSTKRTISSISSSIRPFNNYTLNINFSNYDIGQKTVNSVLDSILLMSQTTSNLGITQNLNLPTKTGMHNLALTYNFQNLTDKNEFATYNSDYNSSTWTGTYLYSFINLSLTTSVNYITTKYTSEAIDNSYAGPTFTISKNFLKNKLGTSIGYSLLSNKIDNEKISTLNRINASANYNVNRHHRFSLRYYLNKNKSEEEKTNLFIENKIELRYAYRF